VYKIGLVKMEAPMARQGFLTTHVLDTANGCPAAGVRIELFALEGNEKRLLASTISNSDGRTDSPLVPKGELRPGIYELVFAMGDYFAGHPSAAKIPFVGEVPVRFGIGDADDHYHVPLLASPFSFSTYRGS
jgi:5-hydroxyisourate hydrolase